MMAIPVDRNMVLPCEVAEAVYATLGPGENSFGFSSACRGLVFRERPPQTRAMSPKAGRGFCFGLVALASLASCKREPTPLEKLGIDEERAREILQEIEKSTARPPPSRPPPPRDEPRGDSNPPERFAPPPLEAQDFNPNLASERFLVDGLVDVTEAAQSSAHPDGVYVVTRDQRLLLAPLGPLSKARTPAASPVAELPDDAGDFALARGPSFSKRHAYWVSNRELLQSALGSKAPGRVVANDARVATRVSATSVDADGEHDLVAYIGLPREPDGPLIARLWSGKGEPITLSEPGSAALSVQLARQGNRIVAYTLEGRTSMSILHAREITVGASGVELGRDRVVWVGGAATPTTELRVAHDAASDVFGLLPIEQDSSTFGLALLELSRAQGDDPVPNQWSTYPNGMDYAPTAADVVCGTPTVLFARPSAAAPHAPQELVLAEVVEGRLAHELVLGRSKVFFDTSLAAVDGGALVSYVADRRTWARTIRCKGR